MSDLAHTISWNADLTGRASRKQGAQTIAFANGLLNAAKKQKMLDEIFQAESN
jgi:hypothetical protein